MKKIYIIIGLTLLLMASPMDEERALALFNSIKQSEYAWVVEQWDAEMNIKTQSRTSTRKSIWQRDENPRDIRENTSLLNMAGVADGKVTTQAPILPPNNPQESETPNSNPPSNQPQTPVVEPQEPVTVPAIK